jgi:MFS family permease
MNSAENEPQSGAGAVARALFHETSFGRLWYAGAVTSTMRWLESLAVGVFVFDLTNSPIMVAVFLFLRWAPLVLFGAWIGVIADRVSRKGILLGGLVAMCFVSGLLAVLMMTDSVALWHIGLAAFLSGTFTSTDYSTRRAMIGEASGMERVGVAMAFDTGTNNGTRMLGPALGGFLLEFIGLHGAYLLGMALYASAAIAVWRMAYAQERPAGPAPKVLANMVEGFRYARSEPMVVGVLSITVIVNAFGFPFASILPVIGRDTLGLSAFPVGILASSEGLGALLGAVFVGLTVLRSRYGKFFVGGSFVFLGGVFLFALSPYFESSLLVLLLAGLGIAGFSSMQSTILLSVAPPEIRGRVMGLLAVSVGTMPIGILYAGFLADWLGAPAGLALVAGQGLFLWLLAALYWRRHVKPLA